MTLQTELYTEDLNALKLQHYLYKDIHASAWQRTAGNNQNSLRSLFHLIQRDSENLRGTAYMYHFRPHFQLRQKSRFTQVCGRRGEKNCATDAPRNSHHLHEKSRTNKHPNPKKTQASKQGPHKMGSIWVRLELRGQWEVNESVARPRKCCCVQSSH